MINEIGDNKSLMIVAASNDGAVVRYSSDHLYTLKKQDALKLENPKELASSSFREKGTFVDLYI